MPTNLLLLPLLGGYWFLHTLYYTRFRSQRLDGYRLLLESAIAAVVLSLLARVFMLLFGLLPQVTALWFAIAPRDVPFLGTACLAFLLGVCCPYVINWTCSKIGWPELLTPTEAQYSAIKRHGNHLLRLVHTAAREERPVLVTLDNRKFYIGLIVDAPNLEAHDAFLSFSAMVQWTPRQRRVNPGLHCRVPTRL